MRCDRRHRRIPVCIRSPIDQRRDFRRLNRQFRSLRVTLRGVSLAEVRSVDADDTVRRTEGRGEGERYSPDGHIEPIERFTQC